MSNSTEIQLSAAIAALAAMPTEAVAYTGLSDASLLSLTSLAGRLRQVADSRGALIAAEVARRSRPELGHSGLAAAAGYRTPEELLRSTTGATVREAAQAVRVGQLARRGDGRDWLEPVGAAVMASELSIAAAESIGNGLGSPTSAVSADELAAAAARLCEEAAFLDPDRLVKRARELRDELDEAGIGDRETARRERRSLRFFRRPDGMSRLTWDMDPETAALVGEVYDRATSPKRGGPRFAQKDAVAGANRILDDTRTSEQLASDVFAQLLSVGADADSSQLLGTGAPVVRVVVAEPRLRDRRGHGYLEGQADPVSIDAVERLTCGAAIVPIRFDEHGTALDVGREQRLYTRRQRHALAVRDGGCRWPRCERPPSWTEAHHINHWARDAGRTDTADGILLCKHHHLLAHNNHWEIHRDHTGDYWLTPPPEVDARQQPLAMPTKSRAMSELQHGHGHGPTQAQQPEHELEHAGTTDRELVTA